MSNATTIEHVTLTTSDSVTQERTGIDPRVIEELKPLVSDLIQPDTIPRTRVVPFFPGYTIQAVCLTDGYPTFYPLRAS